MSHETQLLVSNLLLATACVILGTMSLRRDGARNWRPFWKQEFGRKERLAHAIGFAAFLIGVLLRIAS